MYRDNENHYLYMAFATALISACLLLQMNSFPLRQVNFGARNLSDFISRVEAAFDPPPPPNDQRMQEVVESVGAGLSVFLHVMVFCRSPVSPHPGVEPSS